LRTQTMESFFLHTSIRETDLRLQLIPWS
jgi:hypothetical protein